MYDKFSSLPKEKQQRIINAGLDVFGQNDYKHASTDLIAMKAGISKGSLFYYFKNKKDFYLFLYDYLIEIMTKLVVDEDFMDFSLRAFYSEKESVSENLQAMTQDYEEMTFRKYFSHLDTYKFKDGTEDIFYIYKMLRWMADGYLHDLYMSGKPVEIESLANEFERWMTMIKKLVYKEEYQDE